MSCKNLGIGVKGNRKYEETQKTERSYSVKLYTLALSAVWNQHWERFSSSQYPQLKLQIKFKNIKSSITILTDLFLYNPSSPQINYVMLPHHWHKMTNVTYSIILRPKQAVVQCMQPGEAGHSESCSTNHTPSATPRKSGIKKARKLLHWNMWHETFICFSPFHLLSFSRYI